MWWKPCHGGCLLKVRGELCKVSWKSNDPVSCLAQMTHCSCYHCVAAAFTDSKAAIHIMDTRCSRLPKNRKTAYVLGAGIKTTRNKLRKLFHAIFHAISCNFISIISISISCNIKIVQLIIFFFYHLLRLALLPCNRLWNIFSAILSPFSASSLIQLHREFNAAYVIGSTLKLFPLF